MHRVRRVPIVLRLCTLHKSPCILTIYENLVSFLAVYADSNISQDIVCCQRRVFLCHSFFNPSRQC
ncbi:hypothetical protein KP509_04G005200 [Ceratopteris richardii]|uniref:Uncharacterized protein n=1 Tax=Ceratopteris richardii TaxID=49495 RepID=A0A8T2UPT8_CERRI|nr:hypothetical protein KP509_04G005200 [Ceratopteris richardii]